jgi:hypothetical protein
MTRAPIERLQDDLATLKAALGTELPYDRTHVAMYLFGAGIGVLLAALVWLDLLAYLRPALAVYLGIMLLAWLAQVRHLRAGRAARPARWRWGRTELVASLVAIVLLVGYVVWVAAVGRWQGQWDIPQAFALASSVFFFLGAGGCAWVAADRRRWHLLGAAVILLLGGAVMPLCETRQQFYLVVGGMCALGGTSSGLLLLLQLRRHEVAHAD